MDIKSIAGFAVISKNLDASLSLYQDVLRLPFKRQHDYSYMDKFPGANHFGVWTLQQAAQACFAQDKWPKDIPEPSTTIEFELADTAAVEQAVLELKEAGHVFVHYARMEPWGQTLARFISPEGVLIGLSYAPWLH